MRLLVSVADAIDAAAAVAGGAEIVDAKDPAGDAIAPVTLDTFRAIHREVGPACPVSAAVGNALDEVQVERDARAFAEAGAAFVKVGFPAPVVIDRVHALLAAAVRGAAPAGVVAVAYADDAAGTWPAILVGIAARAGAAGVLLDTADKHGPALLGLVPVAALQSLVEDAHRARLFVALAGRLTAGDLPAVLRTGADIAGVRGAACDDGRRGRVSAARVRQCRSLCATVAPLQEAT